MAISQARDLFENVTDGEQPALRHKTSGLRCIFNGDPDERLVVFPSGRPRGDDVGCTFQLRGVTVSLDVARNRPARQLDVAAADSWRSIVQIHPDARPFAFEGPRGVFAPPPGVPPIQSRDFTMDQDGRRLFSSLSVAVVNGWVVEERVSSDIGDAGFADLYGQAVMLAGIMPMVAQRDGAH